MTRKLFLFHISITYTFFLMKNNYSFYILACIYCKLAILSEDERADSSKSPQIKLSVSNRLFELSERYVGTGLSHSIP
ncbi:hypothetical protein BpHYR1_008795 [Brachionus plicatilis]|uniref:Uncharacterized protein n=1 Tax=Brachionus plicatilis TaxID=10195 RepID=A0A3M7QXK3_BRAPC|nr:hypothetical protein BpHYR1_008795 [Brachionus plicatilis]